MEVFLIIIGSIFFLGNIGQYIWKLKSDAKKDLNLEILIRKHQESTDSLQKEWQEKLDISINNLNNERTESEEELIDTIDILTDNYDNLESDYNKLIDIVTGVYDSAVKLNNFYVEKLKRGFLQDNYEVRELSNQMINFIKNVNETKAKHSDLFEIRISEDEDEE